MLLVNDSDPIVAASAVGWVNICNRALAGNPRDKSKCAIEYNSLLGATSIPITPAATLTGSGSWTCPAGITNVSAACYGGGAGGGNSFGGALNFVGGGGGGAGAYSRLLAIPVTPGNNYSYQGGTTGTATTDGGDAWFVSNTTVLAKGGTHGSDAVLVTPGAGGAGGQAASGIGDFLFNGGDGAAGALLAHGAGGGGAGMISDGGDATGGTAGTGGDFLGGAGGAAGPGNVNSGGGAGGSAALSTGELGAAGPVLLYY